MSPKVPLILLWSLPLVVFIVGGALMFIGMRGRRIDDHPLCRRCGYDLVGNPQATVCPECGSEIAGRKAVKLGHRQRRRVPLIFGILLVLPAMAVGAGAGAISLRGVDLQRHKPVWLLVSEGDADAMKELSRRLGAGELTAAHVRRVNAYILAQQANRARTWDPTWGDFVEAARDKALTNDEQWTTYARQALDFKLGVGRQRFRRGDRIVLTVSPEMDRAGSRSPFLVSWQIASVRLAGVTFARVLPPGESPASPNVFDGLVVPRTYDFAADASSREHLPDGPHPLHVDVKFLVHIGFMPQGVHTVSRQTSVTITPSGEPIEGTAAP